MKWIRQIRGRRQRGQTIIETALMLTVIFIVVFWVFELSWVFYVYTVLSDAANEGVRYSIVQSGGDASGTETVVRDFAATSLHDVSAMTVSVNFYHPDCSGTAVTSPSKPVAPDCVKVDVTYTYLPYLPYFIGTPTMHAYAQGAMVVN